MLQCDSSHGFPHTCQLLVLAEALIGAFSRLCVLQAHRQGIGLTAGTDRGMHGESGQQVVSFREFLESHHIVCVGPQAPFE